MKNDFYRFYHRWQTLTRERRGPLLDLMNQLGEQSKNCENCPGTCCTYMANSMQVTVLEACDLYLYLKDNNLWSDALFEKLESTVETFRLRHRPSTGGGTLLRRNYTCPFYGAKSLGCPIPPMYKPYGCLGFNPGTAFEREGKSCSSEKEVLEKREDLFEEELGSNEQLQNYLGLWWEKESIPVALLDLHKAFQLLQEKDFESSEKA